jgi:hypothetical protein
MVILPLPFRGERCQERPYNYNICIVARDAHQGGLVRHVVDRVDKG